MTDDRIARQRLTCEDVATLWQRPVSWVQRNAIDFGGFKVGGQWRFDPADLEAYETRGKRRDPLAPTELSAKRQATKRRRERGEWW
ncbi:MAG TPA: hypothetical protein VNR17_10175 [Luteimicrobium sp.]|nr:hypothetical protein [Luteimicrobium sp.]